MQNDTRTVSKKPSFEAVSAAARGQWHWLLPELYISEDVLTGRHTHCPGCGGRDRFRFDNQGGRGTWLCSGGGGKPIAGDGFALLEHVFGISAGEALDSVARALNLDRPEPPPKPLRKPPPEAKAGGLAHYAKQLWERAERDDATVSAHPYAIRKGIDWHAGIGRSLVTGRVVGKDADCLVVPITSIPDRSLTAAQCINNAGAKQTFGPVTGSAFQLGDTRDRTAKWFVVEGAADAISTFRANHHSVVCASMGLGSFDSLIDRIVAHYQPNQLVVLEDGQ